MVKSFHSDQEVSGSIPDSSLGFFSSGELFYGTYRLAVPVFQYPWSLFCPMLSTEQAAFCLPQVSGGSPNVSMFVCKFNLHFYIIIIFLR